MAELWHHAVRAVIHGDDTPVTVMRWSKPMLRRATYDSLPFQMKRALHLQIALWIERHVGEPSVQSLLQSEPKLLTIIYPALAHHWIGSYKRGPTSESRLATLRDNVIPRLRHAARVALENIGLMRMPAAAAAILTTLRAELRQVLSPTNGRMLTVPSPGIEEMREFAEASSMFADVCIIRKQPVEAKEALMEALQCIDSTAPVVLGRGGDAGSALRELRWLGRPLWVRAIAYAPPGLGMFGRHLVVLHEQLATIGLIIGESYAEVSALRAINLASLVHRDAQMGERRAGSDQQRAMARKAALKKVRESSLPSALVDSTNIELGALPLAQLVVLMAGERRRHSIWTSKRSRRSVDGASSKRSESSHSTSSREATRPSGGRTTMEGRQDTAHATQEAGAARRITLASSELVAAQILLARACLLGHQASATHRSRRNSARALRWAAKASSLSATLEDPAFLKIFQHQVLAQAAICRSKGCDVGSAVVELRAAMQYAMGLAQHHSIASRQKECEVCGELGFALYMSGAVAEGRALFDRTRQVLNASVYDEAVVAPIILGASVGRVLMGEGMSDMEAELSRFASQAGEDDAGQDQGAASLQRPSIIALATALLGVCQLENGAVRRASQSCERALRILHHEISRVGPAGMRLEDMWTWGFGVDVLLKALDRLPAASDLEADHRQRRSRTGSEQLLMQPEILPDPSAGTSLAEPASTAATLPPSAPTPAGVTYSFVLADALRNMDPASGARLPSAQMIEVQHPEWLTRRTVTWPLVCSGEMAKTYLAVSHRCEAPARETRPHTLAQLLILARASVTRTARPHMRMVSFLPGANLPRRWQRTDQPDPDGHQLEALRRYLLSHREIKYVWYDWCCMPSHAVESLENGAGASASTANEEDDAHKMLQNVSMLYLGCQVLILLESTSQRRFWCQYEAWLAMQQCTADGLAPAVLDAALDSTRRFFVMALGDARQAGTQLYNTLVKIWHGRAAVDVRGILNQPDLAVTHERDRLGQLQTLATLDELVRMAMHERALPGSAHAHDRLSRVTFSWGFKPQEASQQEGRFSLRQSRQSQSRQSQSQSQSPRQSQSSPTSPAASATAGSAAHTAAVASPKPASPGLWGSLRGVGTFLAPSRGRDLASSPIRSDEQNQLLAVASMAVTDLHSFARLREVAMARFYLLRGLLCAREGLEAEALARTESAVRLADERGLPLEAGIALKELGGLLQQTQRPLEAKAVLSRAEALLRETGAVGHLAQVQSLIESCIVVPGQQGKRRRMSGLLNNLGKGRRRSSGSTGLAQSLHAFHTVASEAVRTLGHTTIGAHTPDRANSPNPLEPPGTTAQSSSPIKRAASPFSDPMAV